MTDDGYLKKINLTFIGKEEGGGGQAPPLPYQSKKWDLSREQARRADKGAVAAGRLRGLADGY